MNRIVAWVGPAACLLLGSACADPAPDVRSAAGVNPCSRAEEAKVNDDARSELGQASAVVLIPKKNMKVTIRSDSHGIFAEVESDAGKRIDRPEDLARFTNVRRLVAERYLHKMYDGSWAVDVNIGIEQFVDDQKQVEYSMARLRWDANGLNSVVRSPVVGRRSTLSLPQTFSINEPYSDNFDLVLSEQVNRAGDKGFKRIKTHYHIGCCVMTNDEMYSKLVQTRVEETDEPEPELDAGDQRCREPGPTRDSDDWHSKIQPDTRTKEEDRIVTHDADSKLTREAAFEFLLSTQTFADEAVGDGGDLSEQVASFRLLMKQPDALAVFKDLFKRGHTAGMLYALCAFRTLDRERFDREIKPFETDHSKLRTFSGCSIENVEVHEIVRSENRCALRLSPGQSPAAWMKEHKCEGYVVDILGGGYTWSFLNP